VNSERSFLTQVIDWKSAVKIIEDPSKVMELKITYDGRYSGILMQNLYIYDYASGVWKQIDSRAFGASDRTVTWSTKNPYRYISASGDLSLRVFASRLLFSFSCYADQVAFTVKYTG
jgi:hypothetical protein